MSPCYRTKTRTDTRLSGFVLVSSGVEINPQFYWVVREGFSKAKTGELKASPRNLAKR